MVVCCHRSIHVFELGIINVFRKNSVSKADCIVIIFTAPTVRFVQIVSIKKGNSVKWSGTIGILMASSLTFGVQNQFDHGLPESSMIISKTVSLTVESLSTYVDYLSLAVQWHCDRPVLTQLFWEFRNDTPELVHVAYILINVLHYRHRGSRSRQISWLEVGVCIAEFEMQGAQ